MVGGLLVAVMGFRRTFLMTAVFYLAAALLVLFFARELANPDRVRGARPAQGKADARLLANRGVLLMLAVLVFVYVAPSLNTAGDPPWCCARSMPPPRPVRRGLSFPRRRSPAHGGGDRRPDGWPFRGEAHAGGGDDRRGRGVPARDAGR
ncbi:MAG: hypothetical protein U0531_08685 [Dehalococcoidia bacterium]